MDYGSSAERCTRCPSMDPTRRSCNIIDASKRRSWHCALLRKRNCFDPFQSVIEPLRRLLCTPPTLNRPRRRLSHYRVGNLLSQLCRNPANGRRQSSAQKVSGITHLDRLAESIHIIREVTEADNPVMLYSVGKIPQWCCTWPAKPSIPVLHPFLYCT